MQPSEAAVEAAAKILAFGNVTQEERDEWWDTLPDKDRHRNHARDALTEALPIDRQELADELLRLSDDESMAWQWREGMSDAADVVLGETNE